MVLNEQRELNDGAEVVVAVDARLMELTVEVVLKTADDDVWVDGEDCDKWGVGIRAAVAAKQYVNLQRPSYAQTQHSVLRCSSSQNFTYNSDDTLNSIFWPTSSAALKVGCSSKKHVNRKCRA